MVRNITTRTRPIAGVVANRHEVLLNGVVIHSQVSALDVQQVAAAVARHDEERRLAKLARQQIATGPQKVQCKRCLRNRPVDQFGIRNGRHPVCNECRAKRTVVRKACASATS